MAGKINRIFMFKVPNLDTFIILWKYFKEKNMKFKNICK